MLADRNNGAATEQPKKIAEEIGMTPGAPSVMRRRIASCPLANIEAEASAEASADEISAARRAKRSRDASPSGDGTQASQNAALLFSCGCSELHGHAEDDSGSHGGPDVPTHCQSH